ncbi:MAG: outer membrane lipoprotein carrier protein LolA [bacterium]
MKSCVMLFFATVFFFLFLQAGDKQTPDKVLKRYNSVKMFSADFSQIYTSRVTKTVKNRSGRITYRKPSSIRIDAEKEGELIEQTFINEGNTVFVYHDKKSVLKKEHSRDIEAYLVFLKGVEPIKKQFEIKDSSSNISVAKKAGMKVPDGSLLIKLTPRKTIKNINYIFLVAENNEVTSIIIVDNIHNINQFMFKDISYNKPVKKELFVPKYPDDYEVSSF